MRQTAGVLNRTWLLILGLLSLLAGALLLLLASGQLTGDSAPGLLPASPQDPVITGDIRSIFDPPYIAAIILVLGIVTGILGLLWIIAQIPRKNEARPYRLHDDPARGYTICDPGVLAAAVENQINALPGVTGSSALLRGTANRPELTARVTVNNRADIQDIIDRIQNSTVRDLTTTLEAPLQHLGLRIEVSSRGKTARESQTAAPSPMHDQYVRPDLTGVIMATPRNEHTHHRLAETKAALKTTELIVYLAAVLGTIITAIVVGENGDENAGDPFDASQAMQYITWLTIGYMIARGLAKSGSRHGSDT
jgi:hypothetical protein